MADEEKIQAKFSLDTTEALKSAVDLKNQIVELGDARNISGLIDGLVEMGPAIAVVGTAFFALKEAFDAVFDAEKIRAVNLQFELLTRNAGISTETLRAGLIQASNGLIDSTTLLRSANEAIVRMGDSATRLPELLELARKVAVITGTDAATAFDRITFAIGSGNQRALKHLGIMIDVNAAVQKYATANGVAADTLSLHGKQQAVLNGVLDYGKTALAGVTDTVMKANTTWQQLKASFTEIKEAIELTIEKYAGSAIRKFLTDLQSFAHSVKISINQSSEDTAERLQAQIEISTQKINTLRSNLTKYIVDMADGAENEKKAATETEAALNKEIQHRKELIALQQKHTEEVKKADEQRAASATKESIVDPNKAKEKQAKFLSEMNQLEQSSLKEREKMYKSWEEFVSIHQQKLVNLESEKNKKITQVEHDFLGDTEKIAKLKEEIEHNYLLKVQLENEEFTNEEYSSKVKALNNIARAQDDMFARFATGSKTAFAQGKANFMDFYKFGEQATTELTSAFAQSFEYSIRGSKDVADAMAKNMLTAIGKIANAKGQELVLMGGADLFIDPAAGAAEIAGGLGLIALGGALGAAASGTPSVGGTAPGVSYTPAAKPPSESETVKIAETIPSPGSHAAAKKTVTIEIHGHYFETDQTRTRLVEMIREASDATNFKILSVGGGI